MKDSDGRMRPPRATSPAQGRRLTRHQSLRQRRPDHNADEIIRFVRGQRFEHQPSLLRVQKKAPLPGIGQYGWVKTATSDSGFLDRGPESADSDEEILDNELPYVNRSQNPRLDPFVKDMLTCPLGRNIPATDYQVMSRALPNNSFDVLSPYQNSYNRQISSITGVKTKKKGQSHLVGNNRKACLKKQLPPLERYDIPDRPSAPSPSHTPSPTSNLRDYGEEKPFEFLDL